MKKRLFCKNRFLLYFVFVYEHNRRERCFCDVSTVPKHFLKKDQESWRLTIEVSEVRNYLVTEGFRPLCALCIQMIQLFLRLHPCNRGTALYFWVICPSCSCDHYWKNTGTDWEPDTWCNEFYHFIIYYTLVWNFVGISPMHLISNTDVDH